MADIKCKHLFLLSKRFLKYRREKFVCQDHHDNEGSLSRPFWLICFIFPMKVGGNLPLCFFQELSVHMDVYKTKFEINSSLEYHHMTYIGNTKHTNYKEVHYGSRVTLELLVRALATEKPHCSISILSEVNFALN